MLNWMWHNLSRVPKAMLNLWIRQEIFTTGIKQIPAKLLSTGDVRNIKNQLVLAGFKLKDFLLQNM